MSFEQVLRGNLEAIEQGIELVQSISNEQYTAILSPYASSSMGAHFRHVLDMFNALRFSFEDHSALGLVDYDRRRRGADVEFHKDLALKELKEIKLWISDLKSSSASSLSADLHVKTEVTLSDTQSVTVTSNFVRELIFVSSHAVHHYALINIIAKLQNITLNNEIGLAPATVSYLRNINQQDFV